MQFISVSTTLFDISIQKDILRNGVNCVPLSPISLLEISSLFGKRTLTIIYSSDCPIAQKLALHNRTWGSQ